MSLNLAVDVENDGLLTVPHVWFALFSDLCHFEQELGYDLWSKNLQALVCFLRQLIIFLIVDQVNQDWHTVELDDFALVEIILLHKGSEAETGSFLWLVRTCFQLL